MDLTKEQKKQVESLSREFIHSVVLRMNEIPELGKKLPTENIIGNARDVRLIAKPVMQRINNLSDEMFDKLCKEGKLSGDIQDLYLVLTGQAPPKPHMVAKEKFKKPKQVKPDPVIYEPVPEHVVEKEPEPVKPKGRPKKKPVLTKESIVQETFEEVPKKPRGRPRKKKEQKPKSVISLDKYGFRVNTTSARIMELVEKNRFTLADIALRVGVRQANVSVVVKRIKGPYLVFFERRNGRKILNVRPT